MKLKPPRNGTTRDSSQIDFTDDEFGRSHETHPGFYIMFGFWKGPFKTRDEASEAYREWNYERRS